MKISIVTDEISSDAETAFEIIRSWGVDYVELRSVGDGRYPVVSDYWHYRLPQLLEEFGLRVAAISPGLFQSPFPQDPPPLSHSRRQDVRAVNAALEARSALSQELETLLPLSIEAAGKLGTRNIICFNFARMDHRESPLATDETIDVLRAATETVAAAGCDLLIEVTEPSARPADMVRRVAHPALGINWDPAAAYAGGEDDQYPGGFALLRPYIRHIHFKDARVNPHSGEREWVANGVINWRSALRDLLDDGFDGFISIETHYRPKIAGTRECFDRVRRLLDELRAI